ncbi:NAD(P)/FAD-dependent oxidoreductase [Wenyingzhuangia aestuarii]|uniref:NAD(P)/FAD-dependent oxidoreductase n=1 Tax=Wenyingzhuangia aestuarii TaxID=1647582 RepID=UPI00143AA1A6|nr:FAD-binding oxidoreductase [Wenyingzhuangia aestuarii]NJB81510.1 glycine/D-amino acid oxidase-like deaminating enzyme [Wenyingzhuangia aestuarii]
MQVDYIIVGFGLAGMAISKELEDKGHSIVVLDNASQVSSRVAAGVFNPVILKRFTPVWNADEQLDCLFPFYKEVSEKFGGEYLTFFETLKVFKSIEDQNNWFMACDNPLLEKYMNPKILKDEIKGIHYFEGFGEVKGTGRVLVKKVLDDYILYLKNKNQFLEIPFVHDELEINEESVVYKDITAKKIIFAEGYGLKENPFFNYLPLTGTKGEMLFIKAPELKLTQQIKSALFVLPVGDDTYWIGATFNWNDKTLDPTQGGRKELVDKLNTMIDVPYEIVNQFGGIRPTVKDRRPLVGKHPVHKNLIVFNGMGTRGVMIAPMVAKQLYNYLENKEPLPKEIDIERFK